VVHICWAAAPGIPFPSSLQWTCVPDMLQSNSPLASLFRQRFLNAGCFFVGILEAESCYPWKLPANLKTLTRFLPSKPSHALPSPPSAASAASGRSSSPRCITRIARLGLGCSRSRDKNDDDLLQKFSIKNQDQTKSRLELHN
jgi:hypothetical protein